MAGPRSLTMDEDDLHQPNHKLLKATFSNPELDSANFQSSETWIAANPSNK